MDVRTSWTINGADVTVESWDKASGGGAVGRGLHKLWVTAELSAGGHETRSVDVNLTTAGGNETVGPIAFSSAVARVTAIDYIPDPSNAQPKKIDFRCSWTLSGTTATLDLLVRPTGVGTAAVRANGQTTDSGTQNYDCSDPPTAQVDITVPSGTSSIVAIELIDTGGGGRV